MAGTVKNYPSMTPVKAQGFYSFEVEIPDQDVYVFTPKGLVGFIKIASSSATDYGELWFRGSLATKAWGGTDLEAGAGVLTGTTGTDGKLTISSYGTNLYIENRRGATGVFTVIISSGNDNVE